jgi:hypothetical protein
MATLRSSIFFVLNIVASGMVVYIYHVSQTSNVSRYVHVPNQQAAPIQMTPSNCPPDGITPENSLPTLENQPTKQIDPQKNTENAFTDERIKFLQDLLHPYTSFHDKVIVFSYFICTCKIFIL